MTDQATELVEVVNQPTRNESLDIPYETENVPCDREDAVDNVGEITENDSQREDSQAYEIYPHGVPLWRYSVPEMRPGFPTNFKLMGFYPVMSVARFLLVIDFVLDVATAGTSQN